MLRNRIERLVVASAIAVFALSGAPSSSLWAQKTPSSSRTSTPISSAKAQLEKGDLEGAEESLWKVLGTEPDNEQALTMLGVVRGRQQRFAEAEALFRRVLQLDSKSIVAARNLAGALLAQDKPDEAIQQYNQAIKMNPRDSDLRMELARLELGRGNFGSALSALEGISAVRFPAAAIPLKAASLLGTGRKSEAEALIARAHGAPSVELELARVFVEGNKADAALKALSLVRPVPKIAAAQVAYLKGRALRQKGNSAAAMNSFREAQAADPKSVDALVAMAETLASENKHAESAATLQKARELNPENREVLRHLIV